jgi:Outer membrane protein beta-barrel family
MRKVRLLKKIHPKLAILPLLFLVQPALAQQAETGAKRLTITDFQQYAPVNALEMVSRIPGFTINGGDGRRGFGDNAGNVLIDGDRPSTKTDDIFTLLNRIPAAQVDYIELTESAGGDGEARGKAQIVNVVRKKGTKPSGTYEGGITLGEHGGAAPYLKSSVSLRRGLTTIDLNGGYSSDDTRGGGPEDFFDGQRTLSERRIYDGHGGYKEGNLGAAIKTRSGNTKINANSKLTWNDGFDNRLGPITGPTGLAIGLEKLRTKAPINNFAYEVGGDVEFALAKKLTTKLIALWGQEPQSNLTNVTTSSVVRPTNSFTALSHERASEGIFRVQNDWTGIKNHAVQFGAEIAYNRLRSDLTQSSGTGGAITPLPASNVTVAEWRVEPFVSDVWSLSPAWKLEAGLVYEASWLTLSGDSRGKRSLQFLRPRLIGTWTISKQTTLELRAEREVAQLNFSDFATSVDLSQGNRVDVGNANLVPEQTTALSALIRQKFMDRGSIALKAEYEFIKDTQDRIPITLRDTAGNITNRFDAVGNIGDSKRWNIELEMTLPFDWITRGLGIKGMEVKYTAHYHGSQVTDPVTGLHRRMSGRPEWHQNWAFRHDLTNAGISWGFTAFVHAPSTIYFFDQISRVREKTDLSLFVEYKKLKIGTVQLQVFDATSHLWERDRLFFRDTRASGSINRIIERDRRLDRRFQLSLSGKF